MTSPISLKLMNGQAGYFASLGWDVHIVSSSPASDLRPATHHVIEMAREPSPVKDLVALIRWVVLLRRLSPQVIVAGTPKASLLGATAAFLTRVPGRVYLLRGLRMETATGRQRWLLNRLEQLTIRLSTEVWCVSNSLRHRCLELRLGSAIKLRVIGDGTSNGVDTERFRPAGVGEISRSRAALGLRPDLPVVGFMGRITEDKGIHDLAAAVVTMSSRCRVQLLVVGSVEKQGYWSRCQDTLFAAGVPFVHVDHVNEPEAIYAALDVFCLPSHREGFPNVNLESAASGIPVVTTDATGCVDSVIDGVTGRVVPVGGVSALADALETLLQSPPTSAAMGVAGRRHAVLKFERTRVWAAYGKALAMLADESPSKARAHVDRPEVSDA